MEKIIQRMNKSRVLIVGDIMVDRYLWGQVQRVSPEAPVPVVKKERVTETLGGAGNVANNLAGLGCHVALISVCGQDSTAEALKALLAQKGIQHHLLPDADRPTITKTRIMAHKQQVLRLDDEDLQALSTNMEEKIKNQVNHDLDHCQALVLSDYGKGTLVSKALVQWIIAKARTKDVPVLIDPKGVQWDRYHGATCITPNTAELEAVAGMPLEADEAQLVAAARQVHRSLALQWLLVTRGAQGMCLLGPDGEPILIPAQAREVYDVSGAGDTVIATMAAALATGEGFEQAARMANVAAGIVVGKLGTQPILASEISTALQMNNHAHYHPDAAVKMAALDAAMAKVQDWKAADETLVFTNGCFDLLHPGHISLLYRARALGDRLIVGLNTDASVRRLKGEQRPILQEQDRAAMLSALACVDLVVPFDDDTPLNLIKAIRPHILVKGSDYAPDQVVGKEVVEAYGGCVKLVELVKGYSTTDLAQKIRPTS